MLLRTRPLDKTSLAEQAYGHLRNLLLDRMIQPGGAIGIDALAGTLGVSHTPVREALARLEGDGLVIRLRSGRYKAAPAMTPQDYAHLCQTRLLLEPTAAALAAARPTPEILAGLRQSIQDLGAARRGNHSRDFVKFVDADALFHRTIAHGCGNKFIAGALTQLQAHHRIGTLYHSRGVTDAEAVMTEHGAILEAIRAGDAGAAEAAMRRHIERACGAILGWIADAAAPGQDSPPRASGRQPARAGRRRDQASLAS
ncbi:GntR family transcriptional regulator [Teichococcus wenyumeiae]|nr:GntR family transcriptional regulator [Pseudoroseomonas wenyumeiae]